MVKLNLGCGKDVREGYINIDIRELPGVVWGDVRNLEFDNIDEIRAIDVYEHISHRNSYLMLSNWCGMLNKGGKLIIQTTSLKCLLTAERPENRLIELIFGGQDYPENAHLTAGSSFLMSIWLKRLGMKVTKLIEPYGNGTNMWLEAEKC